MNDFSFQYICTQRRKTHFKHHNYLQISSNIRVYFTVCYIGLIEICLMPNLLTIVVCKVSKAYFINRGYNCYITVSAQVVHVFSSVSVTLQNDMNKNFLGGLQTFKVEKYILTNKSSLRDQLFCPYTVSDLMHLSNSF